VLAFKAVVKLSVCSGEGSRDEDACGTANGKSFILQALIEKERFRLRVVFFGDIAVYSR
jgi:hypothetical protein